MQKKLLFKIAAIALLMLLIGVPLMIIQSTIGERLHFREEAVRSIADDSVREQTVTGPLLVLPYTEEYEALVADKEDKDTSKRVTVVEQRRKLVYPEQLVITGDIGTERRYRGIHQVLVYTGQHKFSGNFQLPQLSELPRHNAGSRITPGLPYMALPVADVRGIRDIPKVQWGSRQIEFEQGSGVLASPSGMHAPLSAADAAPGATVAFQFSLALAGIERQHVVPLGKNNTVTLSSAWPHPQFGGRFLPEQRTISDKGFNARWRVSALASGAQQQLDALEARGEPSARGLAAELDSFNVGFVEPVNIYSQADRATKYGLLFVALTFAAFFVFEILQQLRIHPIQYLLVGLALALFFLLLVGLSEHIEFVWAYLTASVACIVLIGFYLGHVLGRMRRGIGFGAGLSLLYAALYGLLISENNALVLGSLLLFAVLAALMVVTRKVDWYQLGQ
ncbi:cell envelope integrity protein CreD [Oxalobacteraceae bacterium]|nr:cell envelope integrity protein CreD [Oxalobacteraceae bacterium]